MFYKERLDKSIAMAMEAMNGSATPAGNVGPNCLVHRISGYPMVALGLGQASAAYEWTKAMRLVGPTLQMAETAATSAYHVAEPKLGRPINLLTEYGITALDKLEQVVPALKKQPDEVWLDSIEYYNDSRLKSSVDTAISIKDSAISIKDSATQKVTDTKNYCTGVAKHTLVDVPCSAISQSVRYSTLALDALLNGADGLVERYVVPSAATESETGTGNAGVIARSRSIVGKAASGVRDRTLGNVEALQSLLANYTKQMETALLLMDYAKAQQDWAAATVNSAQTEASKLYSDISEKAKFYGKQPDTFILDSTKQLSGGLNYIVQRLSLYSNDHLPSSTLSKSLESAADYTQQFSQNLAEAQTLGEVRTEVIQAMKDNFAHVRTALASTLTSLTQSAPADWVPFRHLRSFSATHDVTSTSTQTPEEEPTEPEPTTTISAEPEESASERTEPEEPESELIVENGEVKSHRVSPSNGHVSAKRAKRPLPR